MTLQNKIIEKINEAYGREPFISGLKKIHKTTPFESKNIVENLFIYYDLLFDVKVDMEADAINCSAGIEILIDIFSLHQKQCLCETEICNFVLTILSYTRQYVSGVHSLAVG